MIFYNKKLFNYKMEIFLYLLTILVLKNLLKFLNLYKKINENNY